MQLPPCSLSSSRPRCCFFCSSSLYYPSQKKTHNQSRSLSACATAFGRRYGLHSHPSTSRRLAAIGLMAICIIQGYKLVCPVPVDTRIHRSFPNGAVCTDEPRAAWCGFLINLSSQSRLRLLALLECRLFVLDKMKDAVNVLALVQCFFFLLFLRECDSQIPTWKLLERWPASSPWLASLAS